MSLFIKKIIKVGNWRYYLKEKESKWRLVLSGAVIRTFTVHYKASHRWVSTTICARVFHVVVEGARRAWAFVRYSYRPVNPHDNITVSHQRHIHFCACAYNFVVMTSLWCVAFVPFVCSALLCIDLVVYAHIMRVSQIQCHVILWTLYVWGSCVLRCPFVMWRRFTPS